MSETERTRAPKRAMPSFLAVPALADQLAAVLQEYSDGTDRSTPVGASLHAMVSGWNAELSELGYTTGRASVVPSSGGTVTPGRFGTDG